MGPGDVNTVLSVGFVYKLDPSLPLPTVQSGTIGAEEVFTAPEFSLRLRPPDVPTTVYGRLFARTKCGVVLYATPVSVLNYQCLVEGTLVHVVTATGPQAPPTLGTKRIEDIWYDDEVVCWDFDRGCLTSAKPLWIKVEERLPEGSAPGWPVVHELRTSTGAVLRTVYGHRVYNAEKGSFTVAHDQDATPVGTKVCVLSAGGAGGASGASGASGHPDSTTPPPEPAEEEEERGRERKQEEAVVRGAWLEDATIVSCEDVTPTCGGLRFFNVLTGNGHLNLFANTVLTSCRYSNHRGRVVDVRTKRWSPDGAEASVLVASGLWSDSHAVVGPLGVPTSNLHVGPLEERVARFAAGLGLSPAHGFPGAWGHCGPLTKEDVAYCQRLVHMAARSVLFLDHQGVMRTAPNPTPGALVDFDVCAVQALNALLAAAPHVDIVVISDWRDWASLTHMQAFYRAQGVLRVPVAFAPRHDWPRVPATPQSTAHHRAEEVFAWLGAPTDGGSRPTKWVALDDLDLAPWVPPHHFVRVLPTLGGLTTAVVQRHVLPRL